MPNSTESSPEHQHPFALNFLAQTQRRDDLKYARHQGPDADIDGQNQRRNRRVDDREHPTTTPSPPTAKPPPVTRLLAALDGGVDA
jgi:hypothetical protein